MCDSKVFKAFCDEKRLAILDILKHEGEICACNIGDRTGMAQSKVSYHMKILCEAKIVACRNVGKWTHYSIREDALQNATTALESILKPSI